MKLEFVSAQENGEILIDNRFETPKGKYQIIISRHNSNLYFFKYRDETLLECQNLGKASVKRR